MSEAMSTNSLSPSDDDYMQEVDELGADDFDAEIEAAEGESDDEEDDEDEDHEDDFKSFCCPLFQFSFSVRCLTTPTHTRRPFRFQAGLTR